MSSMERDLFQIVELSLRISRNILHSEKKVLEIRSPRVISLDILRDHVRIRIRGLRAFFFALDGQRGPHHPKQ
jgi:hypothetical protein